MTNFPDTHEIWVNTTEASEITGYNSEHIRMLARENRKLPEEERYIRVRFRSNRYDLWLADLFQYIEERGYGPHRGKDKKMPEAEKSLDHSS